MSKSLAIQNAQRYAFQYLSSPSIKNNAGQMVKNDYYVNPINITGPAVVAQELPLTTASSPLIFDFSVKAPIATPALNNVLLAQNNIAAIYGLRILFGVGSTGATRQYFTHGLLAGDNAIYQGATLTFKVEQTDLWTNINMLDFKYDNGTEFDMERAVVLTNPLRFLSGRAGINQVVINTQSLAALTFTANAYVRVEFLTVQGQASATK